MTRVIDAKFIKGVPAPSLLGLNDMPVIGITGRSNVGKSTFINRIAGRRSLARTSSTPGCTRTFNVYEICIERGPGKRENIALVDLPGFGYAKFSMKERNHLRKTILQFVEKSERLDLIALLNDARRMPEEDELALRDMAFEADVRVLVVLTKADTLRKNDIKKQLGKIALAYGLEPQDLVLSGRNMSTEAFWRLI